MNDENRSHPATATDTAPTGKLHWGEAPIPPSILASLFLLGIVQYWGLGYLAVTGSVGDVPYTILGFASYFVHWSSVGGLIGFALSRKSIEIVSLIGRDHTAFVGYPFAVPPDAGAATGADASKCGSQFN